LKTNIILEPDNENSNSKESLDQITNNKPENIKTEIIEKTI
jgi:hypothetical protein